MVIPVNEVHRRIRLSVLNLGISSGGGIQSIQAVLQMAQLCESLGYSRYWIAEHHESNSAYGAPDVLLGWLASRTERIRLGLAGVLLRYHDPYLVAQSFALLSGLYPGRIDLGLARGSIGGELKEYFSDHDISAQTLDRKCMQLSRLFQSNQNWSVLRPVNARPDLWMMGSQGAMRAAYANKMKFCLDRFYQEPGDEAIQEIFSEYSASFRTRSFLHQPEYSVAIAGLCAETDELAYRWQSQAPATGFPSAIVKSSVVGSPHRWSDYLHRVSEKWGVTEFVILISTLDVTAQQQSLRLLAEALQLTSDRYNSATDPANVGMARSCQGSPD